MTEEAVGILWREVGDDEIGRKSVALFVMCIGHRLSGAGSDIRSSQHRATVIGDDAGEVVTQLLASPFDKPPFALIVGGLGFGVVEEAESIGAVIVILDIGIEDELELFVMDEAVEHIGDGMASMSDHRVEEKRKQRIVIPFGVNQSINLTADTYNEIKVAHDPFGFTREDANKISLGRFDAIRKSIAVCTGRKGIKRLRADKLHGIIYPQLGKYSLNSGVGIDPIHFVQPHFAAKAPFALESRSTSAYDTVLFEQDDPVAGFGKQCSGGEPTQTAADDSDGFHSLPFMGIVPDISILVKGASFTNVHEWLWGYSFLRRLRCWGVIPR